MKMIGARQHQNRDIPTIRIVTCPACERDRLNKYANADGSIDVANEETVEVRGQQRYLEVCNFCVVRYRKADEKFVTDNMRKLAKAFQDGKSEDGESDHKDFSLN
jgi:hypothetical protein